MDIERFGEAFEEYMNLKRDEMRRMYDRVLPSGELIFNRFDKAKYLNCGQNSSVHDTCAVYGEVVIGDNVWVGPYTILEGSNAPLVIENFVSINAGVMIFTHDSTKYYVSGGKNPFDIGAVTIKSNTVIGTMSMICCNVTIGKHCVIAAHSFVNRDVPDFSIVAGIPAKVIGRVILNEIGVDFEYF